MADGEAQALKIRSAALEQAGKTRGEGDRAALEILAGVQKSPAAREFYEYWKSMEFVKSSLAKNTYLVLPTDADWLRALFNAPAATTATKPGAAATPAPAGAQPSIVAQ